MFEINPENNIITMHRGDTGSARFKAIRTSGLPFGENDVAVWTVRNAKGDIVIRNKYSLADESLGNGVVIVYFYNSTTDHMPLGSYSTEMRYIINPYINPGEIYPSNGDIVRTPINAQGTLIIKEVYGEV